MPRPGAPTAGLDDEARIDAAEQARIDEAVVAVAHRGPGPLVATVLIVAAFLLGLVRPWDWLAGGSASSRPVGDTRPGATAGPGGDVAGTEAGPDPSEPAAELQAPTCGYPTGWRTASISQWAGARARIWTAADAVPATGPGDPSIPFHPVASLGVEAIGWCAPVSGPERPPLAAVGTLFRVRDGVAAELEVDRLEPPSADALGELWTPTTSSGAGPPTWPAGHYVVRLATPSGSYARYLGLEIGTAGPASGVRTPAPGASATPAPVASARPSPRAGVSPAPAGGETASP